MAEDNSKMDEEFRKLDKKGKEKINEGNTKVDELAGLAIDSWVKL